MINSPSLLSITAIVLAVLSIAVLAVNNRVFSARTLNSQVLLLGSLVLALFAFMLHSPFFVVVSAFLFACYTIKLGQYFHVSIKCIRHNEKVPHYRRP